MRGRRAEHRPSSSPFRKLRRVVISLLAACVAAGASAQDRPSLVSAVIRGSTAYTAPELFAAYGDQLGRPISVESARAIATRIAAQYTEDGYSRPGVEIDDRMSGAGVLVFEVIETRISAIEISGDPGPYERELESIGSRVNGAAPLRTADLQSAVRRMRDLPGLRLTASTSRDADLPGAYRLSLDTEFTPVSGTLRLSNRGTDEIGPDFLLGQTTLNGMLSGRASLGVLFGTTLEFDEYHGLGLNGSFRPAGRRFSIQALGFRSRSDPRERVVDRDDRYRRDRATFGATLPLHDSASRRVLLTTSLRAEDLAIDRERARLRDERLRLVELGARWIETTSPSTQFALSAELVQGIDAMGSGLRADDLAADQRRADFTILLLDYVRHAELGGPWSFRLNALGQYTSAVAPYTERFKIGGDRLGRGFEVAEISGDRGLGARVEMLRRISALQTPAGPVSFYFTYDLAGAWKNDRPGRESAATGGLGLVLNGRAMSGRIEVAKPLTHPDVEGREDVSVFVELSYRW